MEDIVHYGRPKKTNNVFDYIYKVCKLILFAVALWIAYLHVTNGRYVYDSLYRYDKWTNTIMPAEDGRFK